MRLLCLTVVMAVLAFADVAAQAIQQTRPTTPAEDQWSVRLQAYQECTEPDSAAQRWLRLVWTDDRTDFARTTERLLSTRLRAIVVNVRSDRGVNYRTLHLRTAVLGEPVLARALPAFDPILATLRRDDCVTVHGTLLAEPGTYVRIVDVTQIDGPVR